LEAVIPRSYAVITVSTINKKGIISKEIVPFLFMVICDEKMRSILYLTVGGEWRTEAGCPLAGREGAQTVGKMRSVFTGRHSHRLHQFEDLLVLKKTRRFFISSTYDSSTYGLVTAQIFPNQSQDFGVCLFFAYDLPIFPNPKTSLERLLNFISLLLCSWHQTERRHQPCPKFLEP
jgi:hypothetical protein